MFFGYESKLIWKIAAIIDSQDHHDVIPVCSERVIGLQQQLSPISLQIFLDAFLLFCLYLLKEDLPLMFEYVTLILVFVHSEILKESLRLP